MAKTWAIFEVYDYKGGELSSRVNLSYKEFISELCGFFDIELDNLSERRDKKINNILDESNDISSDIEYIKNKLKVAIEDEDFYSTYACGGGFCGELYEVDNGMKEVCVDDYLDDIARQMLENILKYYRIIGLPKIKLIIRQYKRRFYLT